MEASWAPYFAAAWIAALPLPAHAMGRAPSPAQPAPPSSSPTDATDTAPSVDKYNADHQLTLTRDPASQPEPQDKCTKALEGQNQFGSRITYFVEQAMNSREPSLAELDPLFGVDPTGLHAAVGLMSHPMCSVTTDSLRTTLAGHHLPSAATVQMANEFATRYNGYRNQALKGDSGARSALTGLWSRFMGCLAYVESLGTADTARSEQVARATAPSDYHRPAGVLFYIDSLQQVESSQLNIGMYQFAPVASGNIRPCILEWNSLYPACRIDPQGGHAEMIHALGGALQDFNTFCGVDKILQTFHVQANTSSPSRTHPQNYSRTRGTLAAPENRCVSLHFYKSLAYVHFGPFMNSTNSNLDELLSCTLEK